MDIAFTISDNYSCHLATTLASILTNANKEDDFSFYILNAGDITPDNKRRIEKLKKIKDFDLNWVTVDNDLFKNYSTGCHISTNYRLKAASLLPDLSKILFMDVDVIILRSLAELYQTNIDKFYFAAVKDPCTGAFLDYVDDIRTLFPEIPYNTGVMLINLDLWRKDNIEEKLFNTISWYSKKYKRTPDQNSLNIVCKDKIKSLDIRYGACPTLGFVQKKPWDYDNKEELKYTFEKPYILHYASARDFKPWLLPNLPYADYYWEYSKMTPYYEEQIMNMELKHLEKLLPQEVKQPIAVSQKKISFLQQIFSVKNEKKNNKKFKILRICGLKFKLKTGGGTTQGRNEKILAGFTVDNKYVKYLSVSIASILKNTCSKDIVFYVLNNGDISDENKKKIDKLKKIKDFQINWITVNDNLYKNQATNLREDITIATNYRFSLPSLLPDVDKIIFLDADLILNADIEELWNIDISDYYMACRPNPQPEDYLKQLDIKAGNKYYNTGVMLCNLKKWREDNIEKAFFENAEKYRHVCQFLDQDILVITLQNKMYDLDLSWNHLSYKNEFNENTKIMHWASANKPWNTPTVPCYKLYKKYAHMTPFYKEIISQNRKKNIDKIKQQLRYWRYKLLSKITFGKMRKHYKRKKNEIKKLTKAS